MKRLIKLWDKVPQVVKDILGIIGIFYAFYVFAQIMGVAQWK